MKITGFSFIRNAIKYDYPILEAIQSVLPLCDDFVIAVGKSEDQTLEMIKNIEGEKVKILELACDKNTKNEPITDAEADAAFAAISGESDWAFFIKGDEVIHERDIETIYSAMRQWRNQKNVDGLLFKFLHFYGSYDYVGTSSGWTNNEVRVIRNDKNIHSFNHAQGFRKGNNEILRVKPLDAHIYHYGWVKPAELINEKEGISEIFGHDDESTKKNSHIFKEFNYNKIETLTPFFDTHPAVMYDRIKKKKGQYCHASANVIIYRYLMRKFFEKHFGSALENRYSILTKIKNLS